jgi:murein DD-endopeptidase MepM/ murein hydrolase activator NlpD
MKRGVAVALGVGGVALLLLTGRERRGAAPDRLGSPLDGDDVPRVTPHGHFGAPRAGPPIHAHQGIDLAARPGSPVLAVGDGTIVATDPGLGLVVRKLRLDEPGTWSDDARRSVAAVVYADLGTPLVEPGQRVRRGDPIALVWSRGFVHFATKERRAGREVFFDPADAGFVYRLASGALVS